MADESNSDLLNLTVDIVTAHVGNNMVAVGDVPAIIQSVYTALSRLAGHSLPAERKEPAVSIRASIKPDYIICLEDGKKLKMLKRHLMANYNMTPAEYRAKWDLPSDYPMVAPNYAAVRRNLAKAIGLGKKPAPAAKPAAAAKRPAAAAKTAAPKAASAAGKNPAAARPRATRKKAG